MNNVLSYCGLVDAIISASEKDLPVPSKSEIIQALLFCYDMTVMSLFI